jgi:hypothetical protein
MAVPEVVSSTAIKAVEIWEVDRVMRQSDQNAVRERLQGEGDYIQQLVTLAVWMITRALCPAGLSRSAFVATKCLIRLRLTATCGVCTFLCHSDSFIIFTGSGYGHRTLTSIPLLLHSPVLPGVREFEATVGRV